MLCGEGRGKDRYPTDSGIYLVESLLGEIKGGFAKREMVDCATDNRRVLNAIVQWARASRFSAFLRFENTPGEKRREREKEPSACFSKYRTNLDAPI